MQHRRIALVGFMASGKSTVGKSLANHLQRPFVDLDQYIESSTGKTIPDIFGSLGEAAFRQLERDALTSVVRGDELIVLATGGGVVTQAANRDVLQREWVCIYLRTRPETVRQRLHRDGVVRPLLAVDNPTEAIRSLMAAREAWYNEVADFTVDVDSLEVPAVVRQIIDWLND
ncbi:shikimate kinase [Alicyclobacillus fastidiosus]|uniref:Shikimate kinase n=1 Tax=Alicyclobacillus fastidiosus TaxID=392011 RepID=A0ABV5AFT9_9BACL|nr:shikimate kinase [Alicyclobacillus fastidiosus]WEH11696.1 shikimate kinase [Alicyclobacillus fastidiosus]